MRASVVVTGHLLRLSQHRRQAKILRLSQLSETALIFVPHMFHIAAGDSEGIGMLTAVRWYRVTSLGEPRGLWRDDLEQARKDAAELGLGVYDEWGQWFDIIPGGIEAVFAIEDQEAA